ncbi:hypothetical protein GCK72_004633 [Caenorhabditis remanei]|uniref:aralkylamine N-acetyltransferase n=1 Tax=Caenorhabditis remanei TaxID=31234 RepID=A0A6A5HCV1_CAERE|nr:hypothetical protein GCK72_004633 [Caenorhabditis remanei]KAF1764684.1 hypothetical protein GCK72_004633 [Caenorhabditis remanei]
MVGYIFRTAEPSDYDAIMKYMDEHYYHEGPTIRATKASKEEWLPRFGKLVERCLIAPLSIVVSTYEGDVVAVSLNSVWKRKEDERNRKRGGHHMALSNYSETMQKYLTMLQKCHDEFWSLAPSDTNIVIYREISSVGAPWQRQGIASKMLIRNLTVAELLGIDGIVSATTSHANQVLLAKHGFKSLKEFPYSSIVSEEGTRLVETDDGSKGMRINFKRIEEYEL